MNAMDRGSKHICQECATKYYDLKKDAAACPSCGAKPLAAKVRRAPQPARKTGHTTFWRYS
jgi:hypothetical protein